MSHAGRIRKAAPAADAPAAVRVLTGPAADRGAAEAERAAAAPAGTRAVPVSPLAAAASGAGTIAAPADLGADLGPELATAGPGRPLDPASRAELEPRFGRDLGGVRLHRGAGPERMSRRVGARAFTRGDHVFFGRGAPDPGSTEGRRLLAHEVAHTQQQAGGGAPVIQREGPTVNPEIARLPANRYVDAFSEVSYDLDYRAEGGNLSTCMTVSYRDKAEIDIGVYDIEDRDVDMIDSMANGHLGPLGRVFPRELTRTTVPRLWAARQEAISIMEQHNYEMMMAAMPAVLFIITMAGTPPLAPTPTVRRITVPRRRFGGAGGGGGSRQAPGPTSAPPAAGAAAAGGASRFSFRLLSQRVLRYGGRDVVVVETSQGAQAFYRRTGMGGANADGAQAGLWAPFDGVLAGWFDKARYVAGAADDPLYRFGNQEFREASEWLGQQGIRAGDDVGEVFSIVNQFLDDLGALKLGGG